MGALAFAIKAQRGPVVSGREEMIGIEGRALGDFTEKGRIHVHGEDWQARSRVPVRRGQTVRVIAIEGLVLTVEPVNEES